MAKVAHIPGKTRGPPLKKITKKKKETKRYKNEHFKKNKVK